MKVAKLISAGTLDKEVEGEDRERLELIYKNQRRCIKRAEQTLARMKATHKRFMDSDVQDVEIEEWTW